uniref:Secreted protein n=1 Tax=Oryza brachyantha TaxID=4533 RepID=J3L934_ORYBR
MVLRELELPHLLLLLGPVAAAAAPAARAPDAGKTCPGAGCRAAMPLTVQQCLAGLDGGTEPPPPATSAAAAGGGGDADWA